MKNNTFYFKKNVTTKKNFGITVTKTPHVDKNLFHSKTGATNLVKLGRHNVKYSDDQIIKCVS